MVLSLDYCVCLNEINCLLYAQVSFDCIRFNKLLNFVKNTASALAKNATGEELKQLSSVSQIAATLSVLLSAYDGLMLGAKLSRSADSVVESVPSTSNVKSAASGLSKLLK